MLQQFSIPQIYKDNLERNGNFMQDGAPPYYLTAVRDFLNDRFQGQWIGRDAPIAWSPRSPDLAPLTFSPGVSSKIWCMYPLLPATLPELRASMNAATEQVTTEVLLRVWEEVGHL